MEDKIEVGEYYRTKNGLIRKIKTIKSGKRQFTRTTVTLINGRHRLEDIVKHSKQLIDLIENKDVLKVRIDKTIMVFGMDEDTSDIKYKELIENIENGEYELLEILTHEYFEANCYKEGGEDE